MPDMQTALTDALVHKRSSTESQTRVELSRKRVVHREKCDGDNVKLLVQAIGNRAAAEAIGFSQSGINSIVNGDKQCSKTADVAAAGVLATLEKPEDASTSQPDVHMIVARVTEAHVHTVETLLNALSINWHNFGIEEQP